MLNAAFFVNGQQVFRLNEKVIGEVSREYGISRTELDILMFLANNSQYDTAKEIVENRMITKSCVSKAVESLVKKGYITTREDEADRRIIHLVLKEEADEVISLGMKAQENMAEKICSGIPAEDMEAFNRTYEKIAENIKEKLNT